MGDASNPYSSPGNVRERMRFLLSPPNPLTGVSPFLQIACDHTRRLPKDAIAIYRNLIE